MKRNRIIAICLALVLLLGCFTACGSAEQTAAPASSETDTAQSAPAAEEMPELEPEAPAEVPSEASAAEVSASAEGSEPAAQVGIPDLSAKANEIVSFTADGYSLPLFADTLEISYWMPIEHDLANLVSSYSDMESYQWVEENLNVKIDWYQCSMEAKSDQFNLMVAGGDYCDLIDAVFELYSGGDDAAIEDEVILELDDYIYDYMPFYTSYFADDDLRKAVMTDTGHFGSIYQIRGEKSNSLTNGPVVRLDWLEECGLPWNRDNLPETLDDWHTILTAFHDRYGAVTLWDPTGVEYIGAWGIYASMPGGQGPMASNLANGYFYDSNGKIVYGPTCDRFRDYIETISQWYAEGLIDPDFITSTDRNYETTMFTEGRTGLWGANNLQEIMVNVPNIEEVLTAIPNPEIDENSYVYGGYSSYTMNNATAISTQCRNVKECMIFLDWFFTQEGSVLATYGMEGVTYERAPDGGFDLTELVTNNPNGLSDKVVICMYSTFGAYLYETSYDNVGLTPTKEAFYNVWKSNWDPENCVVNKTAFTSEEAAEQTAILAEIGTYGGTVFLEWIIGVRELNDASWDEYVKTCNELGADRALELEKTAVDRYNSI